MHFCARLNLYSRLGAFFCNSAAAYRGSVGRSRGQAPNPSSRAAKRRGDPGERRAPDVPLDRHASLAMTAVLRPHRGSYATPQLGSSQGGVGSQFQFNNQMMFLLSRFFLLIQRKRRAGAVCRAGPGFCAPISTDVVRPRASKWADPKEPHPSPAHEPRVGARHEARGLQENNVRSSGPNAFRAYIITDGRQPFVPAASATPACFELSLRFPFLRGGTAVRRRLSARRHPAMVEHNTNKGRLSRQFVDWDMGPRHRASGRTPVFRRAMAGRSGSLYYRIAGGLGVAGRRVAERC